MTAKSAQAGERVADARDAAKSSTISVQTVASAQVLAASSATAEPSHHIQQAVGAFLTSVREG